MTLTRRKRRHIANTSAICYRGAAGAAADVRGEDDVVALEQG
ncbi:MAG: hypothetical protein R2873_03770 [Caldilineaceae bacterium]